MYKFAVAALMAAQACAVKLTDDVVVDETLEEATEENSSVFDLIWSASEGNITNDADFFSGENFHDYIDQVRVGWYNGFAEFNSYDEKSSE